MREINSDRAFLFLFLPSSHRWGPEVVQDWLCFTTGKLRFRKLGVSDGSVTKARWLPPGTRVHHAIHPWCWAFQEMKGTFLGKYFEVVIGAEILCKPQFLAKLQLKFCSVKLKQRGVKGGCKSAFCLLWFLGMDAEGCFIHWHKSVSFRVFSFFLVCYSPGRIDLLSKNHRWHRTCLWEWLKHNKEARVEQELHRVGRTLEKWQSWIYIWLLVIFFRASHQAAASSVPPNKTRQWNKIEHFPSHPWKYFKPDIKSFTQVCLHILMCMQELDASIPSELWSHMVAWLGDKNTQAFTVIELGIAKLPKTCFFSMHLILPSVFLRSSPCLQQLWPTATGTWNFMRTVC